MILIVDGHHDACTSSGDEFLRAGYPCVAAHTTAEALDKLEEFPEVQVALIEWEVEKQGAWKLVGVVRRAQPGLILVGQSAEDRAHDFRALGVEHFIAKPWEVADVLTLVESLLSPLKPSCFREPMQPPGETKKALLEAAEELFSAGGYGAVGIREIASRAGTNVSSIKYHFGSKRELYLDTIRWIPPVSGGRYGFHECGLIGGEFVG